MQCSDVVDDKILFLYIDIDNVDRDGPINLAWRQRVIIYDPQKSVWSEEKTGPTGGSSCFDAGATTGMYAPQRVYALKHTGKVMLTIGHLTVSMTLQLTYGQPLNPCLWPYRVQIW